MLYQNQNFVKCLWIWVLHLVLLHISDAFQPLIQSVGLNITSGIQIVVNDIRKNDKGSVDWPSEMFRLTTAILQQFRVDTNYNLRESNTASGGSRPNDYDSNILSPESTPSANLASHKTTTSVLQRTSLVSRLHLLRIPKASSTALSSVARRLVGCHPPGPCCMYPGDPVGSCPHRGFFRCEEEGKVIGCTHHYAHPEALYDVNIPTISMMREPMSRSLSAFHYHGIHHNSACTRKFRQGLKKNEQLNVETHQIPLQATQMEGIEKCFLEYTIDPKWMNVATKMLTGSYAYSFKDRTCEFDKICKSSAQLAMRTISTIPFNKTSYSDMLPRNTYDSQNLFKNSVTDKRTAPAGNKNTPTNSTKDANTSVFVGISEMWELSILLLHVFLSHFPGYKTVEPQLSDFLVDSETSANDIANKIPLQHRVNNDANYVSSRIAGPKGRTYEQNIRLYNQNKDDIKIYKHVLQNTCQAIHSLRLHDNPLIQQYWDLHLPLLWEPVAISNDNKINTRNQSSGLSSLRTAANLSKQKGTNEGAYSTIELKNCRFHSVLE